MILMLIDTAACFLQSCRAGGWMSSSLQQSLAVSSFLPFAPLSTLSGLRSLYHDSNSLSTKHSKATKMTRFCCTHWVWQITLLLDEQVAQPPQRPQLDTAPLSLSWLHVGENTHAQTNRHTDSQTHTLLPAVGPVAFDCQVAPGTN